MSLLTAREAGLRALPMRVRQSWDACERRPSLRIAPERPGRDGGLKSGTLELSLRFGSHPTLSRPPISASARPAMALLRGAPA